MSEKLLVFFRTNQNHVICFHNLVKWAAGCLFLQLQGEQTLPPYDSNNVAFLNINPGVSILHSVVSAFEKTSRKPQ